MFEACGPKILIPTEPTCNKMVVILIIIIIIITITITIKITITITITIIIMIIIYTRGLEIPGWHPAGYKFTKPRG